MARSGSSTKVEYGAYSFGSQPTPFVTLEQEHINEEGGPADGKWGVIDRVSIQGFLTGVGGGDDCGTQGPSGSAMGNLIQAQLDLISGFSQDFKSLAITDTDGGDYTAYSGDHCVIRDISFDESKYNGLLPYSITLDAYDYNYWNNVVSNASGVVEPEDSYDFNQDPDDEIIQITHTVSARGFNTSSSPNALHNAKTFVHGRTGYKFESYVGFPKFIDVGTAGSDGECFHPILKTQSENIDRINSTYSITETYEADPSGCSGIVLRYSTSLESGINDDFVRGSIDAEATHSKTGSFDDLVQYVKDLDFFDLLTGDTKYENFNRFPITHTLEENETGRAITFNASFDDNNLFTDNVMYEHGVSFSTDSITDVTTATINGTIKARGNLQERIERANDFLENSAQVSDLYSLANEAYGVYQNGGIIDSNFSLRSVPSTHGVTSGVYGEINVTATFDDKWLLASDDRLRDSTYSYDVKAPVRIYKPKAAMNENGLYAVFDTNVVSREEFSVSAQLVGKHGAVAGVDSPAQAGYLEGQANGLVNVLRAKLDDDGEKLRLDSENVSKEDTEASISCNYTYSQNKPTFLSESQYQIGKAKST